MDWNLGDVLDRVCQTIDPALPALIHGATTITWGELDRRSNNLARALIDGGAGPGDKVAFYMRNRAEYTQTFAACLRARLTHININYRYREQELHYILDNSDAVALVYAAEFRDQVAELRPNLPKLTQYIEVSDDGTIADFAVQFEDLATAGEGAPLAIERSPDDELFIYTGGTTGMPKGVVWRAGEFYAALLEVGKVLGPVPADLDELTARLQEEGRGAISIPACPLMHGTGFAGMVSNLMSGGTLVTLTAPSFDADEVWKTVAAHKVERMSIVGDAFGKPLVKALQEGAADLDLSSLVMMTSSGVMWSTEVKRALLEFIPHLALIDSFGASEGLGFGTSIMTAAGESRTGRFAINDLAKVFDDDGVEVTPGSEREGWLGVGGPLPLGYYKDPEKSATVFREFGGKRYSVPGDRCKVDTDGSIIFLGRGSVCINTGGEKVFPEEVEEVLKTHPAIEDALVVGVPDEKWGQAVTAVVVSADTPDEAALRAHVNERLAGYKVPKRVLAAGIELRAANGKADYAGARDFAIAALAQ